MRKPADLHTQIEARRDGEKSINNNKRYRTQLGALVVTTGAGALALERLAGVPLDAVE